MKNYSTPRVLPFTKKEISRNSRCLRVDVVLLEDGRKYHELKTEWKTKYYLQSDSEQKKTKKVEFYDQMCKSEFYCNVKEFEVKLQSQLDTLVEGIITDYASLIGIIKSPIPELGPNCNDVKLFLPLVVQRLKDAVKQASLEAIYQLGSLYAEYGHLLIQYGESTYENFQEQAESLLIQALTAKKAKQLNNIRNNHLKLGHTNAAFSLAGILIQQERYSDAEQILVYGKKMDCTYCINKLGELLQYQHGSYDDAAKLYSKANRRGLPDAAFNLAYLHFHKKDNKFSTENIVDFLKAAADEGHSRSQHLLANLYDEGKEIPKNLTKALSYYQQAADKGLCNAQHELGVIYICQFSEYGIPQNIVQGISLLNIAKNQGCIESSKILDRINSTCGVL
jgi:TPR repeat protein